MKVGDKVICVDDSKATGLVDFINYAYPNWILKDNIYTVREILSNDDIVPGLLLKEIVNPEIYIHLLGHEQEPAFRLSRFVPLDKTLAEITIDKELLVDAGILDPLAI